jgi:predicted transcriptional regulator
MAKSLVEMTAEIVGSQINTTEMSVEEVNQALSKTFTTLKALQQVERSGEELLKVDSVKPVISPDKSIQKNKIICLECGESFKMLSAKHLNSHDLTLKEYRIKHGFKLRQPLCAKALSEKRSQASKERGLPANLRKSIAARAKKKQK